MIASIIIGILILLYSGFVIRKRVKEIKAGKFCSCSGGDCGSCGKVKKDI
jgi:hypothetical protein